VAKYHTDGAYESYHPEAYHALVDLDAALASHPVQGAEGGMSFGAAIREARVAAGLSLRDAAALLGVTVVHLGAVERGLPAPSHTDLMISPEAIDEALADTRRAIEQQGAEGGEREEPVWPRGYTVRIAVEALEGVSVCASLSEQDPDGAWVVMREVTECSTVDAALRALASWEPAPLPQRMECPYCLAVWRPHSVADAECCPSCLRDLPPLASPAPSAPEEE
jgi:transcriptional regulator with XRE-family HTH domain